jgi:hypothetical protein
MRNTALLAMAAITLAIAACIPQSRHPLSDEKTSKIDKQLIGKWSEEHFSLSPDTVALFKPHKGAKNTFEASVPGKPDEKPGIFFTTKINSKRYMSWKYEDAKTGRKSYMICWYEYTDPDTVKIYPLDESVIEKAIVAKELAGEIRVTKKREKMFKTVVITASPDDLAKYLKKHGPKCFFANTPLVYKRQK